MLSICQNCNTSFEVTKFKGRQYAPMVCSVKCLKDYLERRIIISKGITEELLNGKKVDGVEAFENINTGEYRSKIEKRVADFFTENNLHFVFESVSLLYRKKMYLPDFYLPEYYTFVEIKDTVWEQSAYTKFKTFQKRVPLILITKQLLNVWKNNNE